MIRLGFVKKNGKYKPELSNETREGSVYFPGTGI